MTELEFEILDELYFVQPYRHLQDNLSYSEEKICEGLKQLYGKGWIRCFCNMTDELASENINFDSNFKDYFYLASKTGLMAHNTA